MTLEATHDNLRRLQIPVQPVPKQDPKERVKNWDESFLGYSLETAIIEAERCIHCPTAPCQDACPTGNNIPAALILLEEGDVFGAAAKFRETSNLPEMCGRLCPQEVLCEGACVVGFAIRPAPYGKQPPVSIGKLEAFIADYERKHGGVPLPVMKAPSGKKVGIIGSGPAGLGVAEELAKKGHTCTVFESWPVPGGILLYGIPNFKMRKEILQDKLTYLELMGIEFVCNTVIGKDVSVDQMMNELGYDAVFLGTGAPVGGQMRIEGEDLANIYQATEFLVRGNLEPEQLPQNMRVPLDCAGKNVLVVGGGDTSMDCVRTAIRLGAASVVCMYRRTEAEQKGREEERKHAREEGVQFNYLTVPVRFAGKDGVVTEAECQRMQLGKPDESGRRSPVAIKGSEFTLSVDIVVLAIGYSPDDMMEKSTPGLRTTSWKTVRVDEDFQTTRPGVFAGGDNVNGADLVVTAMADGRRAAIAIDNYLKSL